MPTVLGLILFQSELCIRIYINIKYLTCGHRALAFSRTVSLILSASFLCHPFSMHVHIITVHLLDIKTLHWCSLPQLSSEWLFAVRQTMRQGARMSQLIKTWTSVGTSSALIFRKCSCKWPV